MPDAAGKVIVITGASGALGQALALEAGKRAARVALLSRNRNALLEIAEKIEAGNGQAFPVTTDVANPESIRSSFAMIENRWNNIDLLFNAAGVMEPVRRIENIRDSEFINSLGVNILGVYIATREAVIRMNRQTNGGTIINISSGAAIRPYIGWSTYGSQKAAVDMFTRIAAQEFGGDPIRIAAISPGPFESRMQKTLRQSDPDDFPAKEKFVGLYESGGLLQPGTIAPMILEIGLSDWPELSGRVADIRDKNFQNECRQHNILIPRGL
nr:SDR family oxidoreductase [candidate division Zixibacteria bacterium]